MSSGEQVMLYGKKTPVLGADLQIGMWLDSLGQRGARMIYGIRMTDPNSPTRELAFGGFGWSETRWEETVRGDVTYDVVDPDTLVEEPESDFERDEPGKHWSRFGIADGSPDSISEAWCSTWTRQLWYQADLDRDSWAGEDELFAIVRTWYYLVQDGRHYQVNACSVWQIVRDLAEPDDTELDRWVEWCEGAYDGWRNDTELRQMAIDDEAPTIASWNQRVESAGDSWAMLATGDAG